MNDDVDEFNVDDWMDFLMTVEQTDWTALSDEKASSVPWPFFFKTSSVSTKIKKILPADLRTICVKQYRWWMDIQIKETNGEDGRPCQQV